MTISPSMRTMFLPLSLRPGLRPIPRSRHPSSTTVPIARSPRLECLRRPWSPRSRAACVPRPTHHVTAAAAPVRRPATKVVRSWWPGTTIASRCSGAQAALSVGFRKEWMCASALLVIACRIIDRAHNAIMAATGVASIPSFAVTSVMTPATSAAAPITDAITTTLWMVDGNGPCTRWTSELGYWCRLPSRARSLMSARGPWWTYLAPRTQCRSARSVRSAFDRVVFARVQESIKTTSLVEVSLWQQVWILGVRRPATDGRTGLVRRSA